MAEFLIGRRIPELRNGGVFDIAHDIIMIIPAGGHVAVAVDFHGLENGDALIVAEERLMISIIAMQIGHAADIGDKGHRRLRPGLGPGLQGLDLAVQGGDIIRPPVTQPALGPGGGEAETALEILNMALSTREGRSTRTDKRRTGPPYPGKLHRYPGDGDNCSGK